MEDSGIMSVLNKMNAPGFKVASPPVVGSPSSAVAPNVPNSVGTKRALKLKARELGEPIVAYRGWKIGDLGAFYPTDRPDYKAHVKTAMATSYGGNVATTDLDHPIFLKKGDHGRIWAPIISNIDCPYSIPVSDQDTAIAVGSCVLPKCGSTVSAAVVAKIFSLLSSHVRNPRRGLGLSGSIKGLASPIGADYSAWFDYVCYCKLNNQRCYVTTADQKKKANQIFGQDVLTVDFGVANKEPVVYFCSSIPTIGGLADKNKWVPFIANATGPKYYFGLGGVYAIGFSSAQSPLDSFLTYIVNWLGVCAYVHLGHVACLNSSVLSACHREVCRTNVPKVSVGVVGLGEMLGGAKDTSRDVVLGIKPDVDEAPAAWGGFKLSGRIYDCAGHKGEDTYSVINRDSSLGIAPTRIKPENAISKFHDDVLVLKAHTVMANLRAPGQTVRAWYTICQLCNNPFLWNPDNMLEACLIDVNRDNEEDDEKERDDEIEEDSEGEQVIDVPPPSDHVSSSSSSSSSGMASNSEPSGFTGYRASLAKRYGNVAFGHVSNISQLPSDGPKWYSGLTGFKFGDRPSSARGRMLGVLLVSGVEVEVYDSSFVASGAYGILSKSKDPSRDVSEKVAAAANAPFSVAMISSKGVPVKDIKYVGVYEFFIDKFCVVIHCAVRGGKHLLLGFDAACVIDPLFIGSVAAAAPVLLKLCN